MHFYAQPKGVPSMQQRKISLLPQTSNLEDLAKKARAFVQSAKAPATLKAYRSDWKDFDS
jgi:hypothetical protein